MRELFYLTLTRFLPYLLDRKDRLSMAEGIEVRVPFADQELVQYMWNVPNEMKRTGGREKGLLRESLAGMLPDAVLKREKSAFPTFAHPGYIQGMKLAARNVLADPTSPAVPLFDRDKLGELAADTPFPTPAWMLFPLERLVQTDAWMREYRVELV